MTSERQEHDGFRAAPHLSPETLAANGARHHDEVTGALVPPIHLASTFARDEDYGARQSYTYARDAGPTAREAEALVRTLERAEQTMLFNSGMSALVAVLEALPAGARIAVPERMYHVGSAWVRRLARMGRIVADQFRPGDAESLAGAIREGDTRLVWVETPSNPECIVTDIAAASRIARTAGALLLVDGTAAPPSTTVALDLGAQLSFHSGTKYLNGHSDITAGALSFRGAGEFASEVETVRTFHGTALPGFEAWLLMRGLRTLHVRFAKISENALTVARALECHPKVESVHYPSLETHPGHEIAARQMSAGSGGLLSFVVKGDPGAALRVVRRCALFAPATSLGGTESLIEHRKTIEGPESGLPDNFLRLSIGLEDANDLVADLRQALSDVC